MLIDFDILQTRGYNVRTSLASERSGRILRFADSVTATIDGNTLVQEQFNGNGFQIRYSLFRMMSRAKIAGVLEPVSLVGILALRSNIQYTLKGFGKLLLKEGEFALFHSRGHKVLAEVSNKKPSETLEVSWPLEMLREIAPYFKNLDPLFNTAGNAKSFLIPPTACKAGYEALDVAERILDSPFNDEICRIYFRDKVQEYLLLLLRDAGKEPEARVVLTKEEIKKLEEVAEKLLRVPFKHYTIPKIAVETGINEMKLKMAFKQLYGKGLFEYQLAGRMREAKRLLEETDLNLKTIAGLAGYKMTTSFIQKFREFFGYPPGRVKKK